ncbi:hypothetical protein LXL04_031784 [Taraxacum kok-saghyz]
MGEVATDDYEVVIIGAGICGLATALALHKKGIKSIVLERSEALRNITGAAIGIRQNGWRALDQLGVGDILRRTAINMQRKGELRSLKRKELIDTLYAALPPATVKFGCELESIKLNPNTKKPVLQFIDGSSMMPKVVIGCEGGKSIVANFLNVKPTKMFPLCGVRGLSNYPNGHTFNQEFARFRKDNNLVGRIPIDTNLVYWFCARPYIPIDERIKEDPEAIRHSTVALLSDYPEELKEMIEIADANSLSFTNLRYRAPWDLLTGTFCKGSVTVAGDAMHVMGPFLGQGGSAGLEDAVVLARNVSQMGLDRVEEAFNLYVRERRMRVVWLSLQTFFTGMLLAASSRVKKVIGNLRSSDRPRSSQEGNQKPTNGEIGISEEHHWGRNWNPPKWLASSGSAGRRRYPPSDCHTYTEGPNFRAPWLDATRNLDVSLMYNRKGETRCVRRKDLIDTLYAALPPATVKFGCELESIKLDPISTKPLLRFIDGTSIIPKVVIGCEGAKSIVANFLKLKPTKTFPFGEFRGLSNYPNGHSFDYVFTRFKKDNNLVGRIPINNNLVYWFYTQPYVPKGHERIWDDPESLRHSILSLLNDYPQEIKEMIKITEANSLSFARLRHRSPWDLLTGTFCNGSVTVAGDAMHVMGPFLGQGGSAGLEDAVVLARNMAHMGLDRVEEAFNMYVKERRMRVVRLSLQTYLTEIGEGGVSMDSEEVIIIGAGICGLATAVALHKNGIKTLVLERSENLRNDTGTAIGILQNGWRALDQLGVADALRRTAVPILRRGESRSLKRKDLLDILYAALPPATVKFGCELESIKLDPNTSKPVLQFIDGTSIIAKAVIGCDGGKSIVAEFLNLKPTKIYPLRSARGLSNYPNGHSFDYELCRFTNNNNLVGRIPIDDKLVYWFCPQPNVPGDERIWEDPELIRRSTLKSLSDYPEEIKEMIEIADANSLSFTHLRYRAPWDLLRGTFCNGRVTVAGDALHIMGPFLGQGGSAGLEDAVVIARNLARVGLDRVEEGFNLYAKERRMRVVQLSLQTYLTGMSAWGEGQEFDSWLEQLVGFSLAGDLSSRPSVKREAPYDSPRRSGKLSAEAGGGLSPWRRLELGAPRAWFGGGTD